MVNANAAIRAWLWVRRALLGTVATTKKLSCRFLVSLPRSLEKTNNIPFYAAVE